MLHCVPPSTLPSCPVSLPHKYPNPSTWHPWPIPWQQCLHLLFLILFQILHLLIWYLWLKLIVASCGTLATSDTSGWSCPHSSPCPYCQLSTSDTDWLLTYLDFQHIYSGWLLSYSDFQYPIPSLPVKCSPLPTQHFYTKIQHLSFVDCWPHKNTNIQPLYCLCIFLPTPQPKNTCSPSMSLVGKCNHHQISCHCKWWNMN